MQKNWFVQHTGLQLSPYFSAAKIAWVLQNVPGAQEKADRGELLLWNDRQLAGL